MDLRKLILVTLFCSLGLFACGETERGSTESEDRRTDRSVDDGPAQSRVQALDGDRKHWVAAGSRSRLGLVSPKGIPEEVTARFVNDGFGAEFASLGANGWLVAGRSGHVELIDAEGKPVEESRPVFQGDGTPASLNRGADKWLIGSTEGEVQLINRNGQPTGTIEAPFAGAQAVTAAAFGSSSWLVGTDGGALVQLGESQISPIDGTRRNVGGRKIVSIVRSKDTWLVFAETEFARVPPSGNALQFQQISSGRSITTAVFEGGSVALGRDDGRVLVAEPSDLASATWSDALEGEAVRAIASNGTEWLAVGSNGAARRLDGSGSPKGSVVELAAGRGLRGARSLSNGWMVAVDEISAVQRLDPNLKPASNGSDVLGGATVRDVAVGAESMLAVGDGGAYRFLEPNGTPSGSVETLQGGETLRSVAWSGSEFMVAGDGGRVALLAPDGSVKDSFQRLDGEAIPALSWSGQFWLVAASGGTVQRLRANGAPFRDEKVLQLDSVEHVEFNGDQWMVVGGKESKGAFAIVEERFDGDPEVRSIDVVDGRLRAVDWNGSEWLVGGDGGIVVRVGQGGGLNTGGSVPGIRDALYGNPVRAIEFNRDSYLIGGDHGAVRTLQVNATPANPAIAANDFATVHTLEWAIPRGFPGGSCVTDTACTTGTCIGSLASGFCCESDCEGPCESCRSEVTGKPDGQCEPVPAGEEPPEDKEERCPSSEKQTCGKNGTCDGKGSCAYWGTDVECGPPPSCEDGVQKSASHCNGQGECVVDETTQCSPVTRCASGDGGSAATCATTCENSSHCEGELVCLDGDCVDPSEQMEPDTGVQDASGSSGGGGSGGGGGGGGCSAPVEPVPTPWWSIWMLGAVALFRRVRAATGSREEGRR